MKIILSLIVFTFMLVDNQAQNAILPLWEKGITN